MHLKEIYLENFKSFGRKIRIPLMKGFTAVTGPNGSGKSNIADAILFVLGPKSSKMIRAGKLTDLIFNGGNKKQPAKYCKVTLIFENESKLIPIDAPEVRLTRLVKISQTNPDNYYSYFYVNGKPSSLSEFDNLLAYARISADGYNLVQQGDINRITQMTNLERRRILDDIAGITKFDHDINKAEDKRTEVETNLERIFILLEEIKNHLNQLKHDRDAALKYKQMRDELFLAKAQLAHKRKDAVGLEIKSINEQIQKYERDRIELNKKLEKYSQDLVATEKTLEELDNKLAEMGGEEAEQIKDKINELKLTQYRATDAIDTAREDIRVAKEEVSKLQQELKTINKELKQFEKNSDELSENLTAAENDTINTIKKLKELEEIRNRSSQDILGIQRKTVKLTSEIEGKHEKKREFSLDIDRQRGKIERMNTVIQQNQEEVNKIKFELEDITWRIKEHDKKNKDSDKYLEELTSNFHKKKASERSLAKQAHELEEATTRLNREFTKLKTQKDAVESIQKTYSQAVERVLDARDRGLLHGIKGTVAELAEVDPDLEKALTVAAGARMQSIVVSDDESAARAIDYLKHEKLGRATFLPLNKMMTGRPRAKAIMCERNEKSLGFAIDVVKFDEKYRPAFWYVFGDTVIIEDLHTARKLMGGVRLVTRDGEIVEPSGAMVGGTLKAFNLRFGAPSETDFKNISESLRKSIEESERVSSELHVIRGELMELEEQIRTANMGSSTTTIKADDLKSKKTELTKTHKDLKSEFDKQVKELELEQTALANLDEKLTHVNDELAQLEEKREENRQIINKATPQKLTDEINTLNEKQNVLKDTCRDLSSEQKTIATQIEIYNDRKVEVKEKIEFNKKRVLDNNNKITDSKKIREELNDELNTLLKVEAAMDKEMLDIKDKRDQVLESKHKLENTIDNSNTKLMSYGDLILSAKTKLQTVEETIAEIEAELQNYEGIKIEGNLPPTDELNKKIRNFELSMAKLEPVNMKAIDDFDVQAERKEKLDSEVKQLNEQQKNLLKIVENLKKKKKDRLVEVFLSVNVNFQEIYTGLSAGGTAELYLENEEDPFDGGLIIKARPKNKKVLRLEALSGGEKSLTALALIFSIQQYQPSPFYLLDEVDMFLDAINAENVANMVMTNSNTAQFIMISLRKVTLKKAHHVYGITMQNNGITDIIGKVNLNEIGEDGEIPKIPVKASIHDPDIDRGTMYG